MLVVTVGTECEWKIALRQIAPWQITPWIA